MTIETLAVPAPGLLAWGQAGNYNAVDDRLVIAALHAAARGVSGGLVLPPTLTPGTGLTVNIGPWAAVVDCGDGTKAVIGTTQATAIDETASGPARADVLWADISPDLAQYQVGLITEAAAVGRSGVFLGLILIPASASVATAFDMHPGGAKVLGFQPADLTARTASTGSAVTVATMTIPAYSAEVGAVYELRGWGNGQQGSTRSNMFWAAKLNGQAGASFSIGQSAWTATSVTFRCAPDAVAICRSVGTAGKWQLGLTVPMAEQDQYISVPNANFAFGVDTAVTTYLTADTTRDIVFIVTANWDSTPAGATYSQRATMRGRVA